MIKDKAKKLLIPIPDAYKELLEKMSNETGVSQTQLVALATISMLANYENKGAFIFADLLNPEHKKGGKEG